MKNRILILTLALVAGTNWVAAQGTAFTYQGQLENNGSPASGAYNLTFSLFTTNSGGNPIAVPVTNEDVVISNGVFTVPIDFGSGAFTGTSNWLEIAVETNGVNGFTILSPRQQLTPAPYAITAENLASVTEFNTVVPGEEATVSGGEGNTASYFYATVGGGVGNTSSGIQATTGGGYFNVSSGDSSTIGGGQFDYATGDYSTVGGGNNNVSSNAYATVGGGYDNISGGDASSVGGGSGNLSSTNYSTVAGGSANIAIGYAATVGGGQANSADGSYSTVPGGNENIASGYSSTVAGGQDNFADASDATVGGGYNNTASGTAATIAGGADNASSGQYATVAGGRANIAQGDFSFAGGNGAQALHQGSFVWADDNGGAFASTAIDQFSVRALNGVLLAANVQIGTSTGDYRHMQFGGGNSDGFLYGSYPSLGDGIHLGYNYYADANGTGHVINTGGGTSRISAGYAEVTLAVGAVNTAPNTTRLQATTTGVTVYGTFNNSSDRNAKQDFSSVNPSEILDKVLRLPVSEWSYKVDSATRHIGPMGQDFYAAFNIGTDERHIAPIDEGGVALTAIQGLNQKLDQRDAQIQNLEKKLDELEAVVKQLATPK